MLTRNLIIFVSKFFEEYGSLRKNGITEIGYLERVCIPEAASQIWILSWILSCRSPQKLTYKRYLEWISPHILYRRFLKIFKTILYKDDCQWLQLKLWNDEKFTPTETQKFLFLQFLLFENADLTTEPLLRDLWIIIQRPSTITWPMHSMGCCNQMLFWKISDNSIESTCDGVLFSKVPRVRL